MSGLLLQLQSLSVPFGTEFPGTVQELLDLIANYEEIVGGESFNGVNYGDAEPAPSDRDKAWFRTDGGGNPIGWYGWNGAAWVPLPNVLPSGATGDRPISPPDGTQFFDTTIATALIYYSGQWHTLDGTPGDVKFVSGTTLADVLAKNPGWSQYTEGIGRALVGAQTDGSDAETDAGANDVALSVDQMPAHTHEDIVLTGSEADSGDAGNFVVVAATQSVGARTITASTTGSKGNGDSFSVLNQSRYLFSIVKD